MALDVYNIEVRHGAVALGTTRLGFTIVKVHSLGECVDAKHLTTNHTRWISKQLEMSDSQRVISYQHIIQCRVQLDNNKN